MNIVFGPNNYVADIAVCVADDGGTSRKRGAVFPLLDTSRPKKRGEERGEEGRGARAGSRDGATRRVADIA